MFLEASENGFKAFKKLSALLKESKLCSESSASHISDKDSERLSTDQLVPVGLTDVSTHPRHREEEAKRSQGTDTAVSKELHDDSDEENYACVSPPLALGHTLPSTLPLPGENNIVSTELQRPGEGTASWTQSQPMPNALSKTGSQAYAALSGLWWGAHKQIHQAAAAYSSSVPTLVAAAASLQAVPLVTLPTFPQTVELEKRVAAGIRVTSSLTTVCTGLAAVISVEKDELYELSRTGYYLGQVRAHCRTGVGC